MTKIAQKVRSFERDIRRAKGNPLRLKRLTRQMKALRRKIG